MNKKKKGIRWLTSVTLTMAVATLLASTSFGTTQLPAIKATIVYVPAILGVTLLGPLAGAILGAVLGICPMINNTMVPTLLSFAFSSFMNMTGLPGVLKAVWVPVGCRITIDVVAGWLWILSEKMGLSGMAAPLIIGFIGSMTSTAFVMGNTCLSFTSQYAAAKNVAIDAVQGLIMVIATVSGISEAIVAATLVAIIGKVILRFIKQS